MINGHSNMMISIFGRVENIVENEENAIYQHFFFYQWCFQKLSLL